MKKTILTAFVLILLSVNVFAFGLLSGGGGGQSGGSAPASSSVNQGAFQEKINQGAYQ